MQIKIKRPDNDLWVDALDNQKEAFELFITSSDEDKEEDKEKEIIKYNKYGVLIMRLYSNGGTYMINEDGTTTPIADWDNVKAFIVTKDIMDWCPATDYQTWAYMHYLYSNVEQIGYYSKGTIDPPSGYVEIPIDNDGGINSSNIIFTLSRNENGAIFYQMADLIRIRISDNNSYRNTYINGYKAFINRIIGDDE